MLPYKSPADVKIFGAFLCLLACSAGTHATPFSSRNQNPLVLIHGLPWPASADIGEADSLDWGVNYSITNTLNSEATAAESILLDYESQELNFNLNYAFAHRWAVRLDVPLIHYGGGFLDNAIESWHDTFGLPQASRPYVADNEFHLRYLDKARTVIDIDTPNGGLGDIQLGIGNQLLASGRHAASLWLSADLPTGDPAYLTGSSGTDFILQLASRHRLHPDWLVDANLALLLPGDSDLNGVEITDRAWYGQAGVEWRAHPAFDLRVQLNGHTALYPDSELKLLGSSYLLVFGGRIHLQACADLDIAVNEDIKVGASPDVSFILSYRHYSCE